MRTKGNQFCTDCLFCSCNSTLWCMYSINGSYGSQCLASLYTHPVFFSFVFPVWICNLSEFYPVKIATCSNYCNLGGLAVRCTGRFWGFMWEKVEWEVQDESLNWGIPCLLVWNRFTHKLNKEHIKSFFFFFS